MLLCAAPPTWPGSPVDPRLGPWHWNQIMAQLLLLVLLESLTWPAASARCSWRQRRRLYGPPYAEVVVPATWSASMARGPAFGRPRGFPRPLEAQVAECHQLLELCPALGASRLPLVKVWACFHGRSAPLLLPHRLQPKGDGSTRFSLSKRLHLVLRARLHLVLLASACASAWQGVSFCGCEVSRDTGQFRGQ